MQVSLYKPSKPQTATLSSEETSGKSSSVEQARLRMQNYAQKLKSRPEKINDYVYDDRKESRREYRAGVIQAGKTAN